MIQSPVGRLVQRAGRFRRGSAGPPQLPCGIQPCALRAVPAIMVLVPDTAAAGTVRRAGPCTATNALLTDSRSPFTRLGLLFLLDSLRRWERAWEWLMTTDYLAAPENTAQSLASNELIRLLIGSTVEEVERALVSRHLPAATATGPKPRGCSAYRYARCATRSESTSPRGSRCPRTGSKDRLVAWPVVPVARDQPDAVGIRGPYLPCPICPT